MQQESSPGMVILVDKPLTWSSFQVVKKVKWLTKEKRVGHAGTLDPLATGLLIVCTGKKNENHFRDTSGRKGIYRYFLSGRHHTFL